jgi:Na+-translocating ferredoxin:NAD+ oxidoreductase RNF subunit RnfB
MNIKFKPNNCIGCGTCLENCKGEAFKSDEKYSCTYISDRCLQCEECEVLKTCLGDAVEYV